jgi:hypothetical protein
MRLENARHRVLHPTIALRLPRVSSRAATLAATAATGLVAFFVYLTTLAPTVMWYDMGEFATVADTLGIAHNTGYPLLILTGKTFTFLPIGETAWRVNLVSAVFTALAVAVVFGLIHDLTRDHIGAAVGALTLAFASTVWANATWATSYGMNLFFTALVVRFMLSWWRERSPRTLAFAALAFGLGLCNHRLIVLVAPPSVLLLLLGWRSLAPKTVASATAAFLAGLSFYLYLPIRGEMEPALSWAQPAEWRTYWSMFLNGQTPNDYWSIDLADRIDILWAYPSYDLTWAGLALAAAGLAVLAVQARAVAAFFGLMLLLDAAVVETYAIHNVYNYLTPGYLALCVLIGVAASWAVDVVRGIAEERALVRPHLRVAAVAAILALLPAFLLFCNYDRVDRSADYNAYDFARTTLERMPPNAVIMTDSWTSSPLWYVQLVEDYRRDVLVSPIYSVPGDDRAAFARDQLDAGRPVFVAEGLRVDTASLAEDFTVQPVLLDSIERMVTDSLSKPRYRDDLVMTGTLYRVLDDAPETTVDTVPKSAARDVAFSSGVTLVGFETDAVEVGRGQVLRLTYYWRADRPLGADLSAAALFFDRHGTAMQVAGFPLWSQPRTIGQGVLETSQWTPATIYTESYFSLVPRNLAPGTYEIRIAVFDAVSPSAMDHAAELTPVGSVIVR